MRVMIAAGILTISSSAALAWNETQPAQENSPMMPMAYHTKNYCPAGLAPIVMGGVVCCGTPATGKD